MTSSNLPKPVPRHVAIIMDGNNRWAKRRQLSGVAGHRAGVEVVREVLKACAPRGIEVLTLFAFSSENWGRPETEVRGLMALLANYLRSEVRKLNEDEIRLRFIGRRDRFSPRLQRLMRRCEEETAGNRRATLVLALDYGGRWDIAHAARQLAQKVASGELPLAAIDETVMAAELSLSDLPAPDLCIRTAGEQRVSNFMLWQCAYAELWFTDTLWPDFSVSDLDKALEEYARRERRYGLRPPEKVVGEPR
jgi:undecaprenyl diphosphate synthase